jgi:hypothetical protein
MAKVFVDMKEVFDGCDQDCATYAVQMKKCNPKSFIEIAFDDGKTVEQR